MKQKQPDEVGEFAEKLRQLERGERPGLTEQELSWLDTFARAWRRWRWLVDGRRDSFWLSLAALLRCHKLGMAGCQAYLLHACLAEHVEHGRRLGKLPPRRREPKTEDDEKAEAEADGGERPEADEQPAEGDKPEAPKARPPKRPKEPEDRFSWPSVVARLDIEEALARLGADGRMERAVRLRLEGRCRGEIAAALKLGERQASRVINDGMKQLRRLLGDAYR